MWLWLLLLSPFSYAQEMLPAVEVRATAGPLLQHTSSPVWRATEEELQDSSQLQDTLNKAPGVMFTQSGGFGGVGSFYSRGSESRHLVVLTDGLRLNDPSSTGRNFDSAFLYAPFFQNLLFLRGPAPSLYGGDATGGVIELVPRRGSENPQTLMSLTGGSFDTLQGHVMQDWKTDHHQGTVGLAHLRTRGFSRLNRKRHRASEADGAETTQLMQASRHAWSEDISTELLVYGLTGKAEQDDFDDNGDGVDSNDDRTENRQLSLSQTTRGRNWWLKSGFFSQKREQFTTSQSEETYRGEMRVAQAGVRFAKKRFEILSGLDAQQEWQGSPGVKKQNDLAALFALGRLKFDRWSYEVGGRGERHQRYGGFAAAESTLKYEPTEAWTLHAKSARGYKTPSLYQLYAPDTYGPLGNPDLTPETNVTMEAGAEWRNAGLISVVAFQQDFQNLIDYDSSAGYLNRGTLRVQGVETHVISPEHSWGQVSVTWTQLDFSHYSKTPYRRPPYLGTVGWVANWNRWTTELNLRAVGGRRDVGSAKLVAYELLSGSVKWAPNNQQQWALRLGNITDRQYEDVWGYGVAPLNVSLGWTGRY